MDHGVKVIRTSFYYVAAVSFIILLIKFLGKSLQIFHGLLLGNLIKECGQFRVVLVEAND